MARQAGGLGKPEERQPQKSRSIPLSLKLPKEGFPKLKNYVVNAYRERDPFFEVGGDFEKLGDAFSSVLD
ncbi:MAG TPA: hypothetical protein VD840_13550 [Sinorhizobium sp.]|nr:hypothetical protein [Sinorhizobium sp.]